MFEFSSPVVVDKVYLNYVNGDSDLSDWVGNVSNAFNSHQTLSDAFLSALAVSEQNAGGSSDRWADINNGSVSGNILVVAASTLSGQTNDYFKIATLNLSCGGATGAVTASCVVINAVKGLPITSKTLVATGGTGTGYTFSATGLPAGLTMSSTGTISGTPTVTGTFNYTVTIKDSAGNTGTLNCSVTVYAAPTATCVTITAIQGVAITPATMTASGGQGAPYTFSASGLPAGLTMSSAGVISGTPTVSGTFSYTVTIQDSMGNIGTVNCSVTVTPAPTAACATITAIQGVAITPATLTGSGGAGGPYTFSATGLPAGLTMSSSGTISGTPTVSGTFNYTVTVRDSAGNVGTVNCSVTVAPPVSATCATITAVKGTAITAVTMTASGGAGGPYTFSATGLPAGLAMSSSGVISGTPTASGTFNYTVTVKDKNGNSGTVNCSVTVTAPAPPLSLSCPSGATGTVGSAYSSSVAASGGTGPYTFALASGALPPGLTLNASTGAITGTPTSGGNFAFSIKVTDSKGATALSSCSTSCGGSVTWSFEAPVGNLGTSQAYTVNGLTITAYGYSGAGTTGTATALFAKDDGGDEYGLGISGESDSEIDTSHFITLDLSAIIAAGASNAQIMIGSIQSGEGFNLYGSNTLGSIGTLLTTGGSSMDNVSFAIPQFGTYKYISVRASAVDVLINAVSFTLGSCNITIGGTGIVANDAATIGYWHNKNGQALINALNGGSSSTALGNWLANNFPYLYGPSSSNDMTNKSNATVASLFSTLFGSDKTGAQIMAGALASYVTSSTLAGTTATSYGFNSSVSGTGGKVYNVGSNGSSIDLVNNTNYTVMQLLWQVNLEKRNGNYSADANTFNVIFSAINQTGDIQ